jgi:hypothetical protein
MFYFLNFKDMKKIKVYFSFIALLCVFLLSGVKSYSNDNGHLLEKLTCTNSAGQTVAYGCGCPSGDSACIPNPCPKGTHQE